MTEPLRKKRDSMAEKRGRMAVRREQGLAIIDLGTMEIWDGGDLQLVREMLVELVEVERIGSIGIAMPHVKSLPSGFFGTLLDWHEKGIAIRLYSPQSNVREMLWFQHFFEHVSESCFLLYRKSKIDLVPEAEPVRNENWRWLSTRHETA